MEKLTYVGKYLEQINEGFSENVTRVWGWIGGLGATYLSAGSIGLTVLILWGLDLILGSWLALKIKYSNQEDLSDQVKSLIKKNQKSAWSWTKFALSLEKLAVTWILIAGSNVFKAWVSQGGTWMTFGTELLIGLIYFVIVWTEFRSVLHNAALVSENPLLLQLQKWADKTTSTKLNKVLRKTK